MMRAFVLSIVLTACSSNSAAVDAAVPRDGLSCAPSGTCDVGTMCGNACCARGEACVDGTCMCGTHASCENGNTCASGVATPNMCGSICCGVDSACPGIESP